MQFTKTIYIVPDLMVIANYNNRDTMKQIASVKVAQGSRIPLGRKVCEKMGLVKGDYVAIYETDSGEIALAKPEIQIATQGNRSEAEARALGSPT